MTKFRYRKDHGFGVPADLAGAELSRIAGEHGHITSRMVVDEARPDDAPLHPAFEWDNDIAGERYRLHQASTLVRAVVVVPPEEEDVSEHRAFVLAAVADEPRPVYVAAADVIASPEMFADALARLERRLGEARQSVRELRELAEHAGGEPERMARIGLAITAIEAATAAVAGLH